jgi:hypothetical protein
MSILWARLIEFSELITGTFSTKKHIVAKIVRSRTYGANISINWHYITLPTLVLSEVNVLYHG